MFRMFFYPLPLRILRKVNAIWRLRLAAAAAVLVIATVAAAYFILTHDPYAPRRDWPALQAAATASDPARVIVGPNIHVSAALEQFKYWECVLAAHPQDAGRLCVAVMHWRGLDVDITTFYSRDGGATWKLGSDMAPPSRE